jgi:hypothetical protein
MTTVGMSRLEARAIGYAVAQLPIHRGASQDPKPRRSCVSDIGTSSVMS